MGDEAMTAVDEMRAVGQRIWFDDISRSMLDDGTLAELRDDCGVGGVTANPTIYERAISDGDTYRDVLAAQADRARSDPESVFWDLAVEDIQRAADLFSTLFDEAEGLDGLVSLELSPHLAHDTDATIEAGIELFERLDRPNVMVKVPGTPAGVPAIEELTSRGVNVNVTLLFGLSQWEAAWEAYVRGLERRADSTGGPPKVSSVASFFLSRIDVKVNESLPPEHRNRAALAAARLAYEEWASRHDDPQWRRLRDRGARPQQLLWASTSTKDPSLPDTYYVERLLAPATVNTMPGQTLRSLCDLTSIDQPRLDKLEPDEFMDLLAVMERHGLGAAEVAAELQEEGVEKFSASFDSLVDSIRRSTHAAVRS